MGTSSIIATHLILDSQNTCIFPSYSFSDHHTIYISVYISLVTISVTTTIESLSIQYLVPHQLNE